ncbi:uL30 family ribosomal protein [Candidatus Woesearchaeota archaeon]|nr:uL30 family ribosomal protein [Candidatus Woesearchaeota archaeon]
METKLAAIRVRGIVGMSRKMESTLSMLKLYRKNYCAIISNGHSGIGMLKRAKDYITWGEIDEETFKALVSKRGEEFKDRDTDAAGKIRYSDFITAGNKILKKYFRLNAPRKGFGRKGIKHTFKEGGALGYRGEAINDLIRRML